MQRDLSISLTWANIIGAGLIVPIVVTTVAPFTLLYGYNALAPGGWTEVAIVIGLTICGAAVHELLHAWGFRFVGKIDARHVTIGFNAAALAPYVHVDCPVPVRTYRIALVLPGLALGIIPLIIATAIGSPVMLWFSVLSLITCAGDLLVLWLLRVAQGSELALDHPERAGCLVGSPYDPAT